MERERRQISLSSIAENTKIGQSLLEALERDDVSKWPSGIFRRSFVRSYASAIGLNADEIVKEFAERFPDPAEPPPPPPTVETVSVTPVRHSVGGSGSVELVFRVSVPRALVTSLERMAAWRSRAGMVLRRQNT